jgi:hypothetical protein
VNPDTVVGSLMGAGALVLWVVGAYRIRTTDREEQP